MTGDPEVWCEASLTSELSAEEAAGCEVGELFDGTEVEARGGGRIEPGPNVREDVSEDEEAS